MMPLVSIIIPCYNATPRLVACLYSCLNQIYPEIEIIVVDNGSVDGSPEIVQAIQMQTTRPLRLLVCETPSANSARIAGLHAANGDYIQWLDADDELAQDKISLQVESLETNSNANIAYGDWTWKFLRESGSKTIHFHGKFWTDPLLALLVDQWHPPHSYLVRRSAAEQLHNCQAWHPQTLIAMDREYFTWAALLGHQFLYVPDSCVSYVSWSSNQVTRSRSYKDRVQNLYCIFERLRKAAEQGLGSELLPVHWHFLRQDWQLWQPNLEYSRVAQWERSLDSQQICTIEDHARTILYKNWLQFLKERDRHLPKPLLQPEKVFAAFTDWLEIDINWQPIEIETAFPWNSADLSALPLAEFSRTLPLYAPLWNQLRGWLHPRLEVHCSRWMVPQLDAG